MFSCRRNRYFVLKLKFYFYYRILGPRGDALFCKIYKSKLKRHIKRKHKDVKSVNDALSLDEEKQKSFFRKQINLRILQTNIEESGKKSPQFEKNEKSLTEKSNSNLVLWLQYFY